MASAWGNFLVDKGYDASAAMTIYRLCKFTADEQVGPIAAITDDIAGVLQYGITSTDLTNGKGASVRVLGVSEVEAAGAIAVGKWCTLEADGRVSQMVAASGKKIVGKCVGAPATNAGDRIAMMVHHSPTLA